MTYPLTNIATGDLVTASQLNRLPVAVAEASGAGASYTFSSIPQVWSHLMFVCNLQTAAAITSVTLLPSTDAFVDGSKATMYGLGLI